MLNIAVFGDVHGHLRLLWKLCSYWQVEHGVHLDLVLQCGDLGYFPNESTLDKATRRYAALDPEELGFARFFHPERSAGSEDPRMREILLGDPAEPSTVTAPMLWCTGNHEDFQALSRTVGEDNLVTVDRYGRCRLIRSGTSTEFEALRIGAVGGGPEIRGAEAGGFDDRWSRVSDAACLELACGEVLDVLLSHCGPRGSGALAHGSDRLRELIDSAQPPYHFFAHHGSGVPPAVLGSTSSHHLSDVSFVRKTTGMHLFGGLVPGCMGILTWSSPSDHSFVIVEEHWMRHFTWSDFPYL